MSMLHRLGSFPPSQGYQFIIPNHEEACCGGANVDSANWRQDTCTFLVLDPEDAYERLQESSATHLHMNMNKISFGRSISRPMAPEPCGLPLANEERGNLPISTTVASQLQLASCSNIRVLSKILEAPDCSYKSPFGALAVQHDVMESVDAEPQPAPGEEVAVAEVVPPRDSCELGASPVRPESELPVAPAEPFPATPAEAAALPERASITALALADVQPASPAVDLEVGRLSQQPRQSKLAMPAASSVRRLSGEEDTDDGDDATEVVNHATSKRVCVERKSFGCPPTPTSTAKTSERSTSTADDEMFEAADAVVEKHGRPEVSVQGANGPAQLGRAEEDVYASAAAAAAESPRGRRVTARAPSRGRPTCASPGAGARGNSAGAVPKQPTVPGRCTRRAAAEAAAVMAAASRLDAVDEGSEEGKNEDGDEDYVERGQVGRATVGKKRGRNGGGRMAPPGLCRRCFCTETPQWRQGPLGPRTLCNACGARYRKEQGALAKQAPSANQRR